LVLGRKSSAKDRFLRRFFIRHSANDITWDTKNQAADFRFPIVFSVLFENHAQDPDFRAGIPGGDLISRHGFRQGIPQDRCPRGPG